MQNLFKDKLFWLVLGLVLVSMGLVAADVLPRAFMLLPALAVCAFILVLPFQVALLWFFAWLPLSFALPFSAGFDTLGAWRILALVLFGRWLWPRLAGLWQERQALLEFSHAPRWRSLRRALFLVLVGLVWGGVALILSGGALAPGIKHLILLFNALILVPVVSTSVVSKNDFRALLAAFGLATLAAVVIGFLQQLVVFFVPLYDFWQSWARHISPLFSGAATGDLLTYANTWFSYWPGDVATLRIFGPFPDSHSLALFVVLGLIAPTTYWLLKTRRLTLALAAGLLAIVLSGTRGVWLGVAGPLLAAGAVWLAPKVFSKALIRPAVALFFLLLAALPLASAIWVGSVWAERAKLGEAATLSFQRVRSIFDLAELSNRGRLEIWQATIKSIAARPVFGVGPGNFPTVLEQSVSAARRGSSAHSLYLNTAAESGLVGLTLLLALIVVVGQRTRRLWLKAKDPLIQAFSVAFAVYFIWAVSYSLVDVVWLNDRLLALTAGLVGLLFAPYETFSSPSERRR